MKGLNFLAEERRSGGPSQIVEYSRDKVFKFRL